MYLENSLLAPFLHSEQSDYLDYAGNVVLGKSSGSPVTAAAKLEVVGDVSISGAIHQGIQYCSINSAAFSTYYPDADNISRFFVACSEPKIVSLKRAFAPTIV